MIHVKILVGINETDGSMKLLGTNKVNRLYRRVRLQGMKAWRKRWMQNYLIIRY